MAKQLTAAAVARLKPDGSAAGLSLTVQPADAKSWTMRFHRPDASRQSG